MSRERELIGLLRRWMSDEALDNPHAIYVASEAALSQQAEPFAWATFDGEGSYDLRLYEHNESYRDDYLRLNTVPMYQGWVFPLYTAPIAQTATQGKFRMGDLVRKTTGSEWEGHICGTYSTELTPEGYAVESSAHRGSVQIYPVTALEVVE